MSDNVNHPSHYTRWPVEVIDIAEREGFLYGNVLKYSLRAGSKDGSTYEEDMAKAAWYATRYVNNVARCASAADGLFSLWEAGEDVIDYLASRQEDTAEMREYLQDQLAATYDRVNEEVNETWDAT